MSWKNQWLKYVKITDLQLLEIAYIAYFVVTEFALISDEIKLSTGLLKAIVNCDSLV